MPQAEVVCMQYFMKSGSGMSDVLMQVQNCMVELRCVLDRDLVCFT